MTWIAGVAQVASDVTTNSMNQGFQYMANKKSREYNREMSDLAWQREQQMWNMQNAYNSPAAQMKRFTDAGLNPRLIYGQGNPGNATVYPKYNAPDGKFGLPQIERLNILGAYNDIRMKDAQVANMTQLKQKLAEETRIEKAKAVMAEGAAAINDKVVENKLKELDYKNSSYPNQLEGQRLSNNQKRATMMKIASELNLNELQRQRLQKWLDTYNATGINIDRDPWYLRIPAEMIQDFMEW